jgi:phosphohistidine phosphatase
MINTMKLLLLRHGAAVDASAVGGSDEARTLSEEGRVQVTRTARALKQIGLGMERAISSPLPRALETAELTAAEWAFAGTVHTDDRLRPGATVESLLRIMAALVGDGDTLLVGHNPDLELMLRWLVSTGGQANVEMKKGSLAVVRVDGGARGMQSPGCGDLLALYPSKPLARLG